ncbi:MAG: hypothetical protein ACXVEB_10060, partial [Bacteroidia bacterium]
YNTINASFADYLKYGYGCSAPSNNFGTGLEWHMMRRIAGELRDNTYNYSATHYHRWWNLVNNNYNPSSTATWANQPTLADENVKLNAVELIRYSKNPYMLSSVETYRVNGADNTTGEDKEILLSKVLLEYEVQTNVVANNQDPLYPTTTATNDNQKQTVFLLKRVREVPVNSANDNAAVSGLDLTKVPTTHFGYTKVTSTAFETTIGNRINTDVYALTSITDRLGGLTTYEYYDFDFATSLINNIDQWHSTTANIVQGDFADDIQMGKPYSVSFTLSVKKKTVDDITVSGVPAKEWDYSYTTKRINEKTPGNLGDRFYISSHKYETGYEKTIVKEPLLTIGANQARSEYTHYATEQSGLLFGKLKQEFSYNVSGQQVEEKDYEYTSNKAYENGAYRIGTSLIDIDVVDNNFDIGTNRFYASLEGDYANINSLVTIGVPPTSANLSASISFTGTDISTMPFLEQGNSALFDGKYLTSYFTPKTKETVTSYDVAPAAIVSHIVAGLRSSLVPVVPVGSVKLALGAVVTPGAIAAGKYLYVSTSNVTEYQYWDADPQGHTTCDGNRIIDGASPTSYVGYLIYEPSWQLYKKKTYSPQLPDAYNTEENFYFHDIRNMAPSVTNTDTLTNFFALNFTSGYKLRNLPYETRSTTKSQGYDPITKSTYYWYDALFDTKSDFDPDGTVEFTSTDECSSGGSSDPTPPATDCIPELPGHPVPPGYELTIDGASLRWWCPSSAFPHDRTFEPSQPFQQPGDTRTAVHIRDLKNRLFLRYTSRQIDVIPTTNTAYTSIDAGSNKITRFAYNGTSQIYEPLFPYVNLMPHYIEERNIYGEVKLEHDAKGLKTLYDYDPEQTIYFEDLAHPCDSHYLQVFTNMGLPNAETVGYTLSNALTTDYGYYNDHSVSQVTDPNGMVMAYEYDEYARLKATKRNTVMLGTNSYSYWQNDFAKTFNERAEQNYVETYALNDAGSTIAEHSRAYIDPQERKYEILTQVSPDYTNPASLDTKMVYNGLTKYDNWNRNIKQYKPFKKDLTSTSTTVDFTPVFDADEISDAAVSAQTQYESSQRSKPLRASKYGQNITTGYTVNSSYNLIKGNVLVTELGLSTAERTLLLPGTATQYMFLKTSVIDEDGKKIITYTDADGRQVATKTYINTSTVAVTLFNYDSQGNQTIVINPVKQQSTYQYNLLGQVFKKNTVDAGEVRYIYNSDGHVVLEEDANERAGKDNSDVPYMRRYSYDAFGRLAKQERVVPTTTNAFQHPFFWADFSDDADYTDLPSGATNSDFQMQNGFAASTDYAFSLQHYTTVNGWKSTTPYDYITSAGIEKEFFYHDPINLSSPPGYLSSLINTFLSGTAQANLKGRLSYSLSYGFSDNHKIKLTAYSYNADGTMAYELHQFNNYDLTSTDGTTGTGLVQGITYP